MSDNEWLCPHCGFANPYTLRVARQDVCIGCRKEKITMAELNAETKQKITEVEKEIETLVRKSKHIRIAIENLEAEAANLRRELKDLEDESARLGLYRSQLESRLRLASIQIANRRIKAGQTELIS